ncbi:hypothetical protein [Halovivax gelatinilyticus]|uniref:hypothetical protein n=1 Tax=Halovivax gelatinilyticus TaxID=2961597 RepID=UPI0020CA7CB1|nr:hypothetical protein [Halovivax gelatinilyticus]
MRPLQEAPDWAQRLILGGIVVYFVIWIATFSVDSVYLVLASEVLFGIIAIAIGAILYVQSARSIDALTAAGVFLMIGGVLQFVFLVSQFTPVPVPIAYSLASLFIFAGIGAYVYAVWIAR